MSFFRFAGYGSRSNSAAKLPSPAHGSLSSRSRGNAAIGSLRAPGFPEPPGHHTLPGSAAHLPSLSRSPVPGGRCSSVINAGHSDLRACEQETPGADPHLLSALCSRPGVLCMDAAFCFSTNHLVPVRTACNAQSLYSDYFPPLAHTFSSTSPSCCRRYPPAMAARGIWGTSTMLLFLPQGMESSWVVQTAREGNNAASIAWSKFLSWRLVLLFTKQQQINEENGAVTSHLHQKNRLIFPFFYN